MSESIELVSPSAAATRSIGAAIGAVLKGGELLALEGPLGAGKTQFVQGLARGLGAENDAVISPTFVLLREYTGRVRLYHLDAYRLSGPDALLQLGWEELLADQGGVIALEWPSRVGLGPELPTPQHDPELRAAARARLGVAPGMPWFIEFEHAGEDERRLRVSVSPVYHAVVTRAIASWRGR